MHRYVCIHGHFYQPPRENPWLEEIEFQDSSRPYRDWNERIHAECYAPNVATRILGSKGDIVDIVSNYARMSFNFGPTLLSWLQKKKPDVYLAILKADKSSQHYFSGHGSAISQAYNHMIMPLANERDKHTQILWGIRDFEFRFKRKPEGMWLPETAVDIATLEMMAGYGISFTILAPHQAKQIRKKGEKKWRDVQTGTFDIQKPYICPLPSGKKITILFYDGPISHDIAFGDLLQDGVNFANRCLASFPDDKMDRLALSATDGESFGHHHRFGNMGLAYCLYHLEQQKMARPSIPAEFIARNPPSDEVVIQENTSWSCAHGVERWRSDCGCCITARPKWNQKWRVGLRASMDWLRDSLIPVYEKHMSQLCPHPWDVRDAYIDIVLDRSRDNVDAFLKKYCPKARTSDEKIRFLKLLEMQRHAMFMFTSCGWFFDDIAGIEATQIMQYAARAIQLAREVDGLNLEPDFMARLKKADGNTVEFKNGAVVYEKKVMPQVVDLLKVAAHFAISSLYEEYPSKSDIYCYQIETQRYQIYEAGRQKLAVSKAKVRSQITFEEMDVDFCVVVFDDYNLHGCVRPFIDKGAFDKMQNQIRSVFLKGKMPEVVNQMDRYFGGHKYSLWDLFKNEQVKVLNQIFISTLDSVETHFREIYENYYPLMQINPEFHIPVPKVFEMTVEFVLNRDFVDIIKGAVDIKRLDAWVHEIKRWPFMRNNNFVSFEASRKIDSLMQDFARHPKQNELMVTICDILRILKNLSLDLDLWRSQNIYFSMSRSLLTMMQNKAQEGDHKATEWVALFTDLGNYLKIR